MLVPNTLIIMTMNKFNVKVQVFNKLLVDDYTQRVINQLSREYYLAELLTVVESIRKTATLHIRSDNVFTDLRLLEKLELVFVPIQRVRRFKGFSHYFQEPRPNEPFNIYGAVAKNYKLAKELKNAHLLNDQYKIGKLLGYPRCCVRFFVKTYPEYFDPLYQTALNTPHKRKGNTIFLREYYPEIVTLFR